MQTNLSTELIDPSKLTLSEANAELNRQIENARKSVINGAFYLTFARQAVQLHPEHTATANRLQDMVDNIMVLDREIASLIVK